MSVELADCELSPGAQYRASVVALGEGADKAASNDGFPFAVGTLIFGQPDPTTNDALRLGMALPNDITVVGSKQILADQNNSRVLVWNTLPIASNQGADLVLGQPDFSTGQNNYGGIGTRTFLGSNAVASDGTRLIVGDRFNYRVLIWSTFPTQNNQAADVVLGQPNFTTGTSNTGGLSAQSMTEPWVWLCGERLFVSDRNNVRVLVWNTIPTQNNAPPDLVLGQPDMTSSTINNGGLNAQTFADPGRGYCDGNRLFIPDLANHRVLIWNALPTQNFQAADLVLGQVDMISNGPNAGGAVSASGLYSPIAVYADGDTVAVADYLNNRVLLFTSPISGNGQAADVVIGQPNASSSEVNQGGAISASTLSNPNAVTGDGTRLYISDRFNHRILIYSTLPTTDGAPADLVLGQANLLSGRLNNPGPVPAGTLGTPAAVARFGEDGLAVAESDTSRVLLWENAPQSGSDLPNLVLGQPDFTSFGQFGGTASSQSMCAPLSVSADGVHLVVGEQCGRRVAVWNSTPLANQQPFDFVLGQPDATSAVINNGGLSASSLSGGPRAHSDGQRLFIADPQNHRVLVWSEFPSNNAEPADLVLGQPDMVSNAVNNGGISASSLSRPTFVTTWGAGLLVVDQGNNRVLVWNTMPSANQAPANVVLGQPNFSSGSAATAPSAATLTAPNSAHVDDDGHLYVVDAGNHRVLYWDQIPSTQQAPAAAVLGQPNFNANLANDGGLDSGTLQSPSGVTTVGNLVYISDQGNNRLVIQPRP